MKFLKDSKQKKNTENYSGRLCSVFVFEFGEKSQNYLHNGLSLSCLLFITFGFLLQIFVRDASQFHFYSMQCKCIIVVAENEDGTCK